MKEFFGVIAGMVVLGEFTGYYLNSCLGISGTTAVGCDNPAVSEYCEVVRSAVTGQVPQWYADTYGGVSEDIWSDIIEYTTVGPTRRHMDAFLTKVNLLQFFAAEFGGYCSPKVARNAMFESEATIFNPWRDGGCAPDAPASVTVTSGTTPGTFDVVWTAPGSLGGAPPLGYDVEWKRSSQQYHSDRRESVGASELSATIDVGTETDDLSIRVRAINEIDASTEGEVACTHNGTTWTCEFAPPSQRHLAER